MRDHLTIKQIEHREYLKSPLWRSIRSKAIAHYGEVCGRCGEHGSDVHHLTYERVGGNELLEDLQVLCRGCHEAVHIAERKTRHQKTKRRGCTAEALYSMLTDQHKRQIELKYGGNAYSILTSPSKEGWNARKTARRFVGIHFIVGNLDSSNPVYKKQSNSINQFYYRQEYKSIKESGLLNKETARELRNKYFSR